MDHGDWLASFINKPVVAEIGDNWTIFGTVVSISSSHIEFADVDFHNQNEANSTRDVYALENRNLGIRPNRKRLFIPRGQLIALSGLEDVLG